jgi:4-carboxymuconolactone decarboxylase
MNVGVTAPQLRQLADSLADGGHQEAAGSVRAALDRNVADASKR